MDVNESRALTGCMHKTSKMNCLMNVFSWIILALCFVGMINRVRFGIDFTDETWYVAELYLVAKGAVPYSDLWSQAPGFTIPLALFFRMFLEINGGAEGIVLFLRVLYVIWTFFVIILVWRLCKKIPLLLYLPMLAICISSLFDINYNTIGVYYSFFALALLFVREPEKRESEKFGRRFWRWYAVGKIIYRNAGNDCSHFDSSGNGFD